MFLYKWDLSQTIYKTILLIGVDSLKGYTPVI